MNLKFINKKFRFIFSDSIFIQNNIEISIIINITNIDRLT